MRYNYYHTIEICFEEKESNPRETHLENHTMPNCLADKSPPTAQIIQVPYHSSPAQSPKEQNRKKGQNDSVGNLRPLCCGEKYKPGAFLPKLD